LSPEETVSDVPAAERYFEIEYTVEPNYNGWRLDRYLCEKIRRLSRSKVQRIIEKGGVVSERPLKASSLLKPGLTFRLRRIAHDEPDTPQHITELYRDDAVLVLDKPAGLPIHPTARYHNGTLVGVLRQRYGEDFRCDPVHRLDRETSGLVVCARTLESSRRLMRAFAEGQVDKEYVAICEGAPRADRFEVDAPIAEGGPIVRIGVRIDHAVGKPSRTRFEVLRRFEKDGAPFALLRAFPETGRQHQIRVHLREAGHPIVGDKIYGPDEGYFDRFSKHCLEPEAWVRLRLPRHALHAARIDFPHPDDARRVTFEAPFPEDLAAFVEPSNAAAPRLESLRAG
jgi:23S rRNA pseudouridine1911/1915/1917 synthase